MKAYGIPCSLCGATIQVQRRNRLDNWVCVSEAQCRRRAVLGTPAERRCKCSHLESGHYDDLVMGDRLGSCVTSKCRCKGFATAKIPSRRRLKVDIESGGNVVFEWGKYENPLLEAMNRADAKLEKAVNRKYKTALMKSNEALRKEQAEGKVRTGRVRTVPRTRLVRTALPGCVHRGIRLGGIK